MSHVCALWGHVFTVYVLRCTWLLPAGLAGLLLASGSLAQRSLAPIVGLRELNPYVASAVEDWRSRQGLVAALLRQLGPMPVASGRAGQLAGTSSFGMSGVNAHLLLAAEGEAAHMDAPLGVVLPWQRQRHWPAPAPHPLLLNFSASLGGGKGTAPQVAFSGSLGLARLALLQDHVACGTPTLPTTCLIELLLAAAAALNSSNDALGLQPSLARVAVGTPKLLPAGDDMLCTLQLGSGQAEVTSSGGGRHLAASLAGARQTAAVAEHSSGASAPHHLVQLLRLRLPDMQQASPQAVLGQLESGSSAHSGCGWLLQPAAADTTLVHLAAVGSSSALSIASSSAILPTADLGASSSKAWCFSLGSALPGSLAWHSARAQPTCSSSSSNFAVSGLHLQPLVPGQQAGTAVASADASGADSLSYRIQWQAAEVLHEHTPSSSTTSCSQVSVCGSGLRLSLATAAAAGATCGLGSSLATAKRISLMPAQGSTIGSTAVAAGGIEMLQRALATGGSATTVQVEGCFAAASLAASPRDCSSSSAMLAALMKVAAVEQPDRCWAAVLGDSQRPAGRGFSSATQLAADQHGVQLGAGLLGLPLMLRHAVPAQQAGTHHGDSSGLLGAASTGRWVISGGTGALGALSGSWLAGAGARRVQLLGRTGRASTASLAAGGSEPAVVTLLMCDAAAAADAAAVLGGAVPLAGVLHAGGVLADATLPNQTLPGGCNCDASLTRLAGPTHAGQPGLHCICHVSALPESCQP